MWITWEQLRRVAHSPLIVGMTIELLRSLGTCVVQIQSFRVNFACRNRFFNLSAEATVNARNARLCARCAVILLKVKQIPFLSLGQGVYIFEESPKSIQYSIGDVYCPGTNGSNREKCESLGGYVTTSRFICGCGKCGAWLFVHKLPFMWQEHVKTTKNRQNTFSSLKNWTWYTTNNCYLMSHFNQPNLEKNNCGWTTKYKRLLDMCFVQHVETQSVFTFQPNKRLFYTTVKSAKPAATF